MGIISALARRLVQDGGAALVVDYGHARSSLGETLQAVKRHAFVDPLAEPGDADLTAHVDFPALAAATRGTGAAIHGPITQAHFLAALGIAARATRLKQKADTRQGADIDAAVTRLAGTGERHMGVLFKVMAVAHPALPSLPGFDKPPERADAATASAP